MLLWQLKKLSTNEALTEPKKLPNNWGPIFGLEGVKDRLNDLSWLGESYADLGWFQVECPDVKPPTPITLAETEWGKAKAYLAESDWSMLPDVPMTIGDKENWKNYRSALRSIRDQDGFPNQIIWPNKPE